MIICVIICSSVTLQWVELYLRRKHQRIFAICTTSAFGNEPHRMLRFIQLSVDISVAIFRVNVFIEHQQRKRKNKYMHNYSVGTNQ